MGVLTGAAGKLSAGQYYRNIESRLMNVQSRFRKAQRNVKNLESNINSMEKSAKNNLAVSQYAMKADAMARAQNASGWTPDCKDSQVAANYNNLVTQYEIENQRLIAQMQKQIDDQTQQFKDIELAAAKDEEDNLALEKDSLESLLKSAEQDYQACKQMEKSDADMFKPTNAAGNG